MGYPYHCSGERGKVNPWSLRSRSFFRRIWRFGLVLAALLVRLGFRIYGSWQRSEGFAGATVALVVVGWLFVEFLTRSMGGFTVLEDGSIQPQTVAFREEVRPFNNVYLMFILIWFTPLLFAGVSCCDQGCAGGTPRGSPHRRRQRE